MIIFFVNTRISLSNCLSCNLCFLVSPGSTQWEVGRLHQTPGARSGVLVVLVLAVAFI